MVCPRPIQPPCPGIEPPAQPPPKRSAGFTLLELITVVGLVGIFAAIAVPSYQRTIARQKVKAVSTDLYLALIKARSEALKRNANVTVAASSGGWVNGWTLKDSGSNIIEQHSAVTGVTITSTSASNGNCPGSGTNSSLVYQRSGRISGAGTPCFQFDPTSAGSWTGARICLSVDPSGRPYTVSGGSTSC